MSSCRRPQRLPRCWQPSRAWRETVADRRGRRRPVTWRFRCYRSAFCSTCALAIWQASLTFAATPALRADATRRVDAIRGGRRAIGIAWAGAAHHLNDRRRSISPALLAPLFALPGIAWFSLQQGPREAAIADVPGADSLTRLPANAQWPDTAALIDALDPVITVDTSIAHLAGALGKPVYVMLPFAPDWRWGPTGSTTPWYPTARLFRQSTIGDWQTVVAEVGDALRHG